MQDILTKSEIDLFQRTSHFNHEELQHLFFRFIAISNADRLVDKNVLLQIREFASCSPLLGLAFDYETRFSREKVIDFGKFVKVLSHFSPRESTEKKANYLFDVLRCDRVAVIGKDECLQLLSEMNNCSLPLIVLVQVVESIWATLSRHKEGSFKIAERGFQEFFSLADIDAGMTIVL